MLVREQPNKPKQPKEYIQEGVCVRNNFKVNSNFNSLYLDKFYLYFNYNGIYQTTSIKKQCEVETSITNTINTTVYL